MRIVLPARIRRSQCALLCLISFCLVGCLAGCGTSGAFVTGGTPTPTSYPYLTGDWVLQATPTTGMSPFSSLSGSIDEHVGAVGVEHLTTAVLQVQPSTCYTGVPKVPLQGTLLSTALGLRSFSVNGQYLNLNLTKDAAASQLTGTYSVDGGCAGGAAGTVTGTRYGNLSGTYKGNVTGSSPAQTLQLALTENVLATGDGSFLVTGSGAFSGFACFTSGTLAGSSGVVLGNTTKLTLTTNDSGGSQVVLIGTINPAADTIVLTSVVVSGGTCAGTLNGATLALQK